MLTTEVRGSLVAEGSGRPHISVVTSNLLGGGCEKVLANLAIGLADLGQRVEVVAANATGPNLERLAQHVRVVNLKASSMRAAVLPLVRYLRGSVPDAVISGLHGTNLGAIAATVLTQHRAALIVTVHSVFSEELNVARSAHTRALQAIIPRAYKVADAIVGVSQYVARDFAASIGAPQERVLAIYNPVIAADTFLQCNEAPNHSWFENLSRPVVLGIGRLEPVKNFPALIRAFAEVRRQRDARLIIIGEGPQRRHLLQIAQDCGVSQDVDLPGYVTNPYSMLARASAFVQASAREASPTALVEALACGCPVVATDCPGGTREILWNRHLGSLVPVADDHLLAAAITKTINQRPPRVDPSQLEAYTVPYAAARYANVVKEVLGDRARRYP